MKKNEYLFVIICLVILSCEESDKRMSKENLFQKLDHISSGYESGNFEVEDDYLKIVEDLAKYDLEIVSEVENQFLKTDNELKKMVLVQTLGRILENNKDTSEGQRLTEFLIGHLGDVGSFELIPVVFQEVLIMEKDLIPILINNLENENEIARKWSLEFLVQITSNEELNFDIENKQSALTYIEKWKKWWEENKNKLIWDSNIKVAVKEQ